ncbi:hypothetical protein Q8A73_005886 [Channa argus]|nr:hypothetical protein Q8A73_005886 [Channa argus]
MCRLPPSPPGAYRTAPCRAVPKVARSSLSLRFVGTETPDAQRGGRRGTQSVCPSDSHHTGDPIAFIPGEAASLATESLCNLSRQRRLLPTHDNKGSSSPGCHGSQRLFLGVWRNPTGRAYAVVYFCISVSFAGMKAAKPLVPLFVVVLACTQVSLLQ